MRLEAQGKTIEVSSRHGRAGEEQFPALYDNSTRQDNADISGQFRAAVGATCGEEHGQCPRGDFIHAGQNFDKQAGSEGPVPAHQPGQHQADDDVQRIVKRRRKSFREQWKQEPLQPVGDEGDKARDPNPISCQGFHACRCVEYSCYTISTYIWDKRSSWTAFVQPGVAGWRQ